MNFELGDVNKSILFDPADAGAGDSFMIGDTVYLTVETSEDHFSFINMRNFALVTAEKKQYLLGCEAVKVKVRCTCTLDLQ